MPPSSSIQHKLDRVRKPRVHITYDVETGGAPIKKELPFVLGVLANLSGHVDPENPLPPLKQRAMEQIDRDNFDRVMEGIRPRLQLLVKNELNPKSEDDKLKIELLFRGLQDFGPDGIVDQVGPLRELREARKRLSDLLNKMGNSPTLEDVLSQIVKDTDLRRRLQEEMGEATPAQAED